MIKIALVLTMLIPAFIFTHSQQCNLYFISKEGSSLEYHQYNTKKKLSGRLVEKIIGKSTISNAIELDIESTSFDKDNQPIFTSNFTVKCENEIYYFDMNNYFHSQEQEIASYEIKGDQLDIPSNAKEGQILKNGDLDISLTDNSLFKMNISISNRKVEGFEKITTEAGSFDCIKISFEAETKMMATINSKGMEWYAKDVGLVKSESYDSKGNVSHIMELIKITE